MLLHKKTLNVLILLLLVSFVPLSAKSSSLCFDIFRSPINGELPQQLTIMAYNVENLSWSVGGFKRTEKKEMEVLRHKAPAPKDQHKSQKISSILNEVLPDILVLTEVESLSALKSAAKTLKVPYLSYMLEGNDHRNINISFLIKKDLDLDIVYESHKHMKWRDPVDDKVDKLFTRDAPAMILHRAGHSEPFLIVIGVHAKSKRDRHGDYESTLWRSAEFRGYVSIIKNYKQRFGEKIPIILAGDLNTDVVSSPEMKILREELSSAFGAAQRATPLQQRITHTYHPNAHTTVSNQLDDIQISRSLKQSVIEAQVYRYRTDKGVLIPFPKTIEERNQLPSDHWPVFIKLSTEGL